jgi:hypothetical protein
MTFRTEKTTIENDKISVRLADSETGESIDLTVDYGKIKMPGPLAGIANSRIDRYAVGVVQQAVLKYAEQIVFAMQHAIATGDGEVTTRP